MAYRLPPAGTKTVESDHFAFCKVLAKPQPREENTSAPRVGGCLLRPKFVVLPARKSSTEDDGCIQITCRCEDDLGEQFRSGRQCHDIPVLVLKAPQQVIPIPPRDPCCRIPNMRRREVPPREPEVCPPPNAVLEVVEDPFMVTGSIERRGCSEGSLYVNGASEPRCCSTAGPPGRDRQIFHVVPSTRNPQPKNCCKKRA
ncbi:hypothetical protein EGW08_012402 [Elysia chlorotica]|uniref:Uncharacterized protein n=1 Tax=Elysia chlorotica TaxID=188477 RepID=A0A3S1BBU8_ELYCH|nr:hypothetical protein EGW08_012402 [Elysia chlorotica]